MFEGRLALLTYTDFLFTTASAMPSIMPLTVVSYFWRPCISSRSLLYLVLNSLVFYIFIFSISCVRCSTWLLYFSMD